MLRNDKSFININFFFNTFPAHSIQTCCFIHFQLFCIAKQIALITGDNGKKADEAVEDEIGVSQPSKCPFSHAEAMQKINDYLAYYRCQPEATP